MSIGHGAVVPDDDVSMTIVVTGNSSSTPTACPETTVEVVPSSSTLNEIRESKPFACNLCRAGFSRIDHLARHFRSHTNKKPFRCDICEKGFARPILLARHKSNHGPSDNNAADLVTKERPTRRARACKACIRCAESKLRCEGVDPCERCRRKGLPCRYEDSKSRTRDPGGRSPISTNSASEREMAGGNVDVSAEVADKTRMTTADSPIGRPAAYSDDQPQLQSWGEEELMQQSYVMNLEPDLIFDDVCNPASTTSDAWSDNYHDHTFMEFLNGVDTGTGLDFNVVDSENPAGPSPPSDLLCSGYPSFSLDSDSMCLKTSCTNAKLQNSKAGTGLSEYLGTQRGLLNSPLHWRQLSTDQWNSPPSLHSSGPFEKLIPPSRWPSKALSPRPAFQAGTRNRLIATILSLSDNHHLAHILSCFPSLELLNNLVDNYFSSVASDTDSWLHAPSFDPNNELPELVLTVVTAGALQPNVPELKQLGLAFWQINYSLGMRLFSQDSRTADLLSHLQALALELDLGLWGGDRRSVEMSEGLSMSGITMSRRAGFLKRGTSTFDPPQREDSPEMTATKWHRWIKCESSKRLAAHLLIQDAQNSVASTQPPILCYVEFSIPLPATQELWSAKSAEAWQRAYLSKDPTRLNNLPSLHISVDDISTVLEYIDEVDINLTALAILSALTAHTFQCAQRSRSRSLSALRTTSLLLTSLYQETRDRLESFHATFTDCCREGLEPATRVLYEHQLMNLHVSIEDLQCLAGKEGVSQAHNIIPGMTKWAATKEGREAVWHAGQLLAAAKVHENSTAREWTAVAVMHATLVLWAFAVLGCEKDGPGLLDVSGEALDTRPVVVREVQVDGMDGPAVRQFLLLGRGKPAISSWCSGGGRRDVEDSSVPLHHVKSLVTALADFLLARYAPPKHEPALVTHLIQLVRALG